MRMIVICKAKEALYVRRGLLRELLLLLPILVFRIVIVPFIVYFLVFICTAVRICIGSVAGSSGIGGGLCGTR